MKINVSIEVPEWEAGSDEDGIAGRAGLTGQIIQEAARQVLAGRIDYNKPDIRSACIAEVSRQIEAQATPVVAEAIREAFSASLRQTNQYGEPVGEPTTLRAVIVKHAEAFMHQKVDGRGEVSSYGEKFGTRVEWMVRKAVQDAITGELGAELKKATDAVKAQLTGNMTKLMAEGVNKLLGVNVTS